MDEENSELLQTRDFVFRVTKKWADRYFENKLKYSVVNFQTKEPLYSSFEEWFEDYGYEKGIDVYNDAKKDNVVVEVDFY